MHKGRVVFGAMDEVVFGYPAVQAIIGKWIACRRRARS